MKRLEKGRFKLPQIDPTSKVATIAASELALLLEGIDTQKIARPARQTGRAQLAHPAFAPGLRFRSRHFSHGTWQPK